MLAAGVLLLLLALFAHDDAWAWLGIEHYPGKQFIDTIAVLSAGQAWHAGLNVYLPNPFDIFGRPHVYGPWWLVTGPMGLTVADALWIGPLLGLAFLVAAAGVLAPRRPGTAVVAGLLLAAPPVLLAFERGNNDLVVFILLASGGALLAHPRRSAGAAGLLWLAAALKIYPLVALPALAAQKASRRAILGGIGLAGAGCLLVFLLWHADYTGALAVAPRPYSIFTYGVSLLALMWVWPARQVAVIVQFLAVGMAAPAAAVWLWRRSRVLWEAVPSTGAVAAWFFAGAASWCFCYLANTNYPYRAVLLLLPARLWLDQAGGPDRVAAGVARVQLAAVIAFTWLLPLKARLASLLGRWSGADVGLGFIVGVEQALVAGVTVALLISLAGWLWRRLRIAGPV